MGSSVVGVGHKTSPYLNHAAEAVQDLEVAGDRLREESKITPWSGYRLEKSDLTYNL